jgi:hypothetical protein
MISVFEGFLVYRSLSRKARNVTGVLRSPFSAWLNKHPLLILGSSIYNREAKFQLYSGGIVPMMLVRTIASAHANQRFPTIEPRN